MQMTEYQEVNYFLHDILKTVIVLTRRNINAKPIFAMIFTVKFVLIIRTINIQTWWRFGHTYVHAQWWYCADRRYTPLSYGAACYLVRIDSTSTYSIVPFLQKYNIIVFLKKGYCYQTRGLFEATTGHRFWSTCLRWYLFGCYHQVHLQFWLLDRPIM